MKSNHRVFTGFLVSLLLLGANAWIAHHAVRQFAETQVWVTHTYEVLREVETDVSLAKDIETGTRGYVITANCKFLEPYQKARLKVQDKLEPLYFLCSPCSLWLLKISTASFADVRQSAPAPARE